MDSNLDEFKCQLKAVDQALLTTTDADERTELQALRSSLLELLELTGATNQVTTPDDSKNAGSQEDSDPIDDEMKRFMSELKEIEQSSDEKPTADAEDLETKLEHLKKELEQLIGKKCSAPHQHAWGAVTYHNALVCGLDDDVEVNEDGSLDAKLRVLFTNPTHKEMLPCNFFLEGECRFDEDRCHYSHGELVSASQLRDYMEPNFESLKRNCVVLAKLQDRLWHKGRVLCVNFVEKHCRIHLEGKEHKEREKDFAFEDLLPIYHDGELSSDSSTDGGDDSETESLDDYEEARRARMVEQSLFTFKPTEALGEWEKYTKGIGSKLMAKMGYVHGTGLGSDGQGIVTPVSAQILPQGRSLDHCMELREAANGDKDLFSVEKRLHRERRKQENLNAKNYEKECQRVDVFSFLNDKILSQQESSANDEKPTTSKKAQTAIQQQTTKNLNIHSVRLTDDIRRKEREIAKVRESIKRNENCGDMQKRLQAQLQARTQELEALQHAEKTITKEQATRVTKSKLCIF